MKRCLKVLCPAVLAMSAALAQEKKTVPPPPKPADDGPSLEVTMKFIQDKMNDHGTVGYVYTKSDLNGVLFREYYLISDVVADALACTLYVKEKITTQVEVNQGTTYNEGGKPVSGDDLHRETFETSTSPFKAVDSITVEPGQDVANRRSAEAAHPEVTWTFAPVVYALSLNAKTKDAFSSHEAVSKGKQPPQSSDRVDKQNTFAFRDEQTANRIAKAMLHAVELCGGGNKEPF